MIRNVDALRDDQWELLKDLVPGGVGCAWSVVAVLSHGSIL